MMSIMDVIERSEAFVHKDDDLVFDHTKIILRRKEDGQYFYSRTPKRIPSSSTVDIAELHLIDIPRENVWPVFNPKFTKAPQPLPPNTYVKQPSILDYGDAPASLKLGDQMLNEVEVCEMLMKHPHPNVGRYLGCIVEDGRITGLCFIRYSMTLSEKHRRGIPFDKNSCLEGIENGVGHLHKLGLVHNDLNPRNIMMEGDDPVIIDFDSCERQGRELGLKGSTKGWAVEGVSRASRDNDAYSIAKIREFLMEKR